MTIEQVKKLSDEELRIRVAELCGWTITQTPFDHRTYKFWLVAPNGRHSATAWPSVEECWVFWSSAGVPDYPRDLNACHEMEKLMTDEQYALWRKHLCDLWGNGFRVYSATARQRCEAFVLVMEGQ